LAKTDQIIEFSEISDLITQPIRTYSSSMVGRLGFSVVADLDLQLLLIDEVLAVGDMYLLNNPGEMAGVRQVRHNNLNGLTRFRVESSRAF